MRKSPAKSPVLLQAEAWATNLEPRRYWGFFVASPGTSDGPLYDLLLDWQEQGGRGQAWSEQDRNVKLLALAFAVAVLEAE
jgi:hypothetical protein